MVVTGSLDAWVRRGDCDQAKMKGDDVILLIESVMVQRRSVCMMV